MGWQDNKRHFRVTTDTFVKLLSEKGMKRLSISSKHGSLLVCVV